LQIEILFVTLCDGDFCAILRKLENFKLLMCYSTQTTQKFDSDSDEQTEQLFHAVSLPN